MRSIQKIAEQDIPLIRQLTFQVWPQTYAALLTPQQIEYMLDLMYSEESLRRQMSEGAQFIAVYDAGEPVGFASYQQIKPAVYKLHKLYVLPSQQGKGTGRFMIDWIINEITPLGARALQLQVYKKNKAKSFYEKLGFAVIKDINIDIGNGFFMDDYLMQIEL